RVDPERLRAGVPHRQGVLVTLVPGGGVGVAGVDRNGPQGARVALIAADADRRGGSGVPGQGQGRLDLRHVTSHHPDLGGPPAVEAAGDASGAEPGSELRRLELLELRGRRHPPRAEEGLRRSAHEMPSPSGRPSIRFRFWIAWEAAPFQRLSIEAKAITCPEASFCARWILQRLVPRTPLTPGGSVVTSTKGSSP